MKKILALFMLILVIPFLSSCEELKFENACRKLLRNNYTMEGTVDLELTVNRSGHSKTQKTLVELFIQSNRNEVYSDTTADGITISSYTKIKRKQVINYTSSGLGWEKEVIDIDDYKSDSGFIFIDVNTSDVFTLEDNVWIGDTEIITDIYEDYLIDLIAEENLEFEIDFLNVSKYNMEMTGNNISKVDIVTTAIMSSLGTHVVLNLKISMDISKVGGTKVTVPSDLPE